MLKFMAFKWDLKDNYAWKRRRGHHRYTYPEEHPAGEWDQAWGDRNTIAGALAYCNAQSPTMTEIAAELINRMAKNGHAAFVMAYTSWEYYGTSARGG
jgi:hypothetical protein